MYNAPIEIIKLLIEFGANLNTIQFGLFRYALKFKASKDIIELLIEHGENINAICDLAGNNVLCFALKNNASNDIIKLLIEKDAKVICKNGRTGLYLTLNKYSEDIKELFRKKIIYSP